MKSCFFLPCPDDSEGHDFGSQHIPRIKRYCWSSISVEFIRVVRMYEYVDHDVEEQRIPERKRLRRVVMRREHVTTRVEKQRAFRHAVHVRLRAARQLPSLPLSTTGSPDRPLLPHFPSFVLCYLLATPSCSKASFHHDECRRPPTFRCSRPP